MPPGRRRPGQQQKGQGAHAAGQAAAQALEAFLGPGPLRLPPALVLIAQGVDVPFLGADALVQPGGQGLQGLLHPGQGLRVRGRACGPRLDLGEAPGLGGQVLGDAVQPAAELIGQAVGQSLCQTLGGGPGIGLGQEPGQGLLGLLDTVLQGEQGAVPVGLHGQVRQGVADDRGLGTHPLDPGAQGLDPAVQGTGQGLGAGLLGPQGLQAGHQPGTPALPFQVQAVQVADPTAQLGQGLGDGGQGRLDLGATLGLLVLLVALAALVGVGLGLEVGAGGLGLGAALGRRRQLADVVIEHGQRPLLVVLHALPRGGCTLGGGIVCPSAPGPRPRDQRASASRQRASVSSTRAPAVSPV